MNPRSDRKRLGPTSDHFCDFLLIALTSGDSCHRCSCYCHAGVFHRRRTRGQPPCLIDPVGNKFILWRIFFPFHRHSFGLSQVLSFLLQQLHHPARILDECRICYPHRSIRFTPWRTRQALGTECQHRVECRRFRLGQPSDRFLRFFALHRGLAQHQSDESRHAHVLERMSPVYCR